MHPSERIAHIEPLVRRSFHGGVRNFGTVRNANQKSIKAYRGGLTGLLRWFGHPPHLLTREDVRCYLEFLVDAGMSTSTASSSASPARLDHAGASAA